MPAFSRETELCGVRGTPTVLRIFFDQSCTLQWNQFTNLFTPTPPAFAAGEAFPAPSPEYPFPVPKALRSALPPGKRKEEEGGADNAPDAILQALQGKKEEVKQMVYGSLIALYHRMTSPGRSSSMRSPTTALSSWEIRELMTRGTFTARQPPPMTGPLLSEGLAVNFQVHWTHNRYWELTELSGTGMNKIETLSQVMDPKNLEGRKRNEFDKK